MEDSLIIQALWERLESGLAALADKYGPRLLATARNILGSHEDAEETVDDTYFAVWNSIPPQRPDPFSGFVFKTGRNLALKRLRTNTAQKRGGGTYALSLDELAGCIPSQAMQEAVEARELGRAIDSFLDTLPKMSRVIFLRRYWFGDEVRQIATDFSMTANAVSVRLARIRQQLYLYLNKEGFLDA